MSGSQWNVFVPYTKARATQVNQDFEWIQGDFIPFNSGTTFDATYDLGSVTKRWRDGFFSRDVHANTRLFVGVNTFSTAVVGVGFVRAAADQNMIFRTATAYTTTAFALHFINDAMSANIPLEIRASHIKLTTGDFALASGAAAINEISIDDTFAFATDTVLYTGKATKTFVESKLFVTGTSSYSTTANTADTASAVDFTSFTLTATLSLTADGNQMMLVANQQYIHSANTAGGKITYQTYILIDSQTNTSILETSERTVALPVPSGVTSATYGITFTLNTSMTDTPSSGAHTYYLYARATGDGATNTTSGISSGFLSVIR